MVGLVQGRTRAANGIAHSRLGAKPLARSECAEGVPKERRYVAEEFFAYSQDRAGMAYRVSSSRAGWRVCKKN